MPTKRLYYDDPNLVKFEARVTDTRQLGGRSEVALEQTAFYPTSGGQPFDKGTLSTAASRAEVCDVVDDDAGLIWHVLDQSVPFEIGGLVQGEVDAERRLDHRQQHTGQHVLSAVLWQQFGLATVSFHMGDASCTIDLDSEVSEAQLSHARELANKVIAENHPLSIHYCSTEEARHRGVRKIAQGLEHVRLIEIPGVDLNACGGTHVNSTGEIGCILTRKIERVRQGTRIEFACGLRAIRTAMRDYDELRSASSVLSAGIWSIAAQAMKQAADLKAQSKTIATLQAELAESLAAQIAHQPGGVLARSFEGKDAPFVKLLAQKVVNASKEPLIVLFATMQPLPTIIFARTGHESLAQAHMGELLKSFLEPFGGRGGGSAVLAQGSVSDPASLSLALTKAAEELRTRYSLF